MGQNAGDDALEEVVQCQRLLGGRREDMTFIDAIKTCFTKYANFDGCASRPEFWWWFLFTVIAGLALQAVSYNLSGAFSIATFLPGLAVGMRRLHDTDRSGWWLLLYFLPIIGWIVLIVFWAESGQPNRYGGSD
jgi:uncharacterized membrane protein YhaH (DUF805 family)